MQYQPRVRDLGIVRSISIVKSDRMVWYSLSVLIECYLILDHDSSRHDRDVHIHSFSRCDVRTSVLIDAYSSFSFFCVVSREGWSAKT